MTHDSVTPTPDPNRRRLLATLAATGASALAGCGAQNVDRPPGRDIGTDTWTMTSTPTDDDDGDGESTTNLANPPVWTTGQTFGVGTVADHGTADPSKTWFTLTEGALAEPRFPRIDLLNASSLSFVVTDGDDYVAHTHAPPGTDDTLERRVEPVDADALAFRQTVTETADDPPDWTLTVESVADPARDAILIDLAFESSAILTISLVCDPTPSGRADYTRAETREREDGYALTATDTGADGIVMTDRAGDPHVVSLALAADGVGFPYAAVGPRGDPTVQQFLAEGAGNPGAETGVVTLAGRVAWDVGRTERTLALGFATEGDADAALATATAALDDGFDAARSGYVDSWRNYLDGVSVPDSVAGDDALADQYRSAAMVLKAVEDKTYAGAGIASPSVPWGSRVDASEARDYGYNFVWARDLYQVFTAFDAMGDVESAVDALEYVFAYQHDGEGFLPQNTFVDGRTRWGGEQLDEIAFPLVMAYQLRERHGYGFADAGYDYESVRALAEYVVHYGPRTEQERWEEEDGYSPSTIAAEIAGLSCAASLAHDEGREDDALAYLAVADSWRRAVADWCATTTGTDGDEGPTPYYIRVSDDADPDDGTHRSLANGGPTLDERAIVDAGFLELVRLGVVSWDDPAVRNSLAVVDDAIRVDTPNGPAWYRYNGDGYGELGPGGAHEPGTPWSVTHEGRGRLWPILTGERAEYELLAGTEDGALSPDNLLRTMQRFANDGRMIPEQVWDRPESTAYGWEFGEGTASATPLAWSMAQYVRLAHSLDAGAPVETPRFVSERYGSGRTPTPPDLAVSWPESVVDSSSVTVSGTTDADTVLVRTSEDSIRTSPTDGAFAVEVPMAAGRNSVTVVAAGAGTFPDRGLTAARRSISYVE